MRRLASYLAIATLSLALVGCSPPGGAAVKTGTEPAVAPAAPTTAAIDAQNVSAQQSAALEALRVPIEKELAQPVVFVTDRFEISDGWAFVGGQTVKPDGGSIDYAQTPYKVAVAQGAFDDHFSALLHLENGVWKVVIYRIGATDVPWVEWPKTYGAPPAIFPPL